LAKKKKSEKKAPTSNQSKANRVLFWGLPTAAASELAAPKDHKTGLCGRLLICGRQGDYKAHLASIDKWQKALFNNDEMPVVRLSTEKGPLWLCRPWLLDKGQKKGDLKKSLYAKTRHCMGQVMQEASAVKLNVLQVEALGLEDEDMRGAVVGLGMAAYRFRHYWPLAKQQSPQVPVIEWQGFADSLVFECMSIARSVNIARHLVNLAPCDLTPVEFANSVAAMHEKSQGITVEVWDEKRLRKEGLRLLLAVGGAAESPPRLVHISYRPKVKNAKPPVAIVGKGITFDSGGLDIKPPSGMRLMKKDMGGAAAVVGFSQYLADVQPAQPVDIYLALAENAISQAAFRPGDVIIARSGLAVEIDNTDAEGRLVLADAIDVALSAKGKDKPVALVDVATLTGAIKIGLGSEVAGVFSNDDPLADMLVKAAEVGGEAMWRMPLYQDYLGQLRSDVADFANSSASRMGGAITAALFLQQFVGETPWAHLDIYAWQDQPSGAWQEAGGSGQAVQTLIAAFANPAVTAD